MRTFWTIEVTCCDCDGDGFVFHPRRGEDVECPYCDAGIVTMQEPGDYYEDAIEVRHDYPAARNVWLEHVT